MWKKRLVVLAIAGITFLTVGISAYAGNINAAEQTIIDFYSGTVVYDGKTYQFTEAAKASVYNKLISDDVDLTQVQARSAIRQAKKNLKQGIEEGYLVEVTGNSDTEPGDGENTEPEDGKDTEPGDGKDTEPEDGKDTEPGNGKDTEPEDGKDTESGNGEKDPGDVKENPGTGENPKESGGKNEGNKESDDPKVNRKKIDLEDLMDDARKDEEHNDVYGVEEDKDTGETQITGTSLTVEQYKEGKVVAVTKEGEVLLETGLPIKNTGFYTGGVKKVLIAVAIILLAVIFAALWIGKEKKNRKMLNYIGVPLVFVVVFVSATVIFSDALGNKIDKWKCVWIAGAPEYSYVYARENSVQSEELPEEGTISQEEITYPLSGEQYGELTCERIGLQTPLYYGDSEEMLEKGAGTYVGGYLPGMGGTILIGAHDATFFAPLEMIEEQDVISLTTVYGQYQYRVTEKKASDVKDTSAYEIKDEEERLILYTCYPFGAEDELRSQRFYVYAEKISGPEVGE